MNPHVPTLTALAGPAFRIRDERPGDAGARERLLDAAFGPDRFAKTCERLREGRRPADRLALVAEDAAGRSVGTVRLWHVEIGTAGPGLMLGPVAVAAEVRRFGLGGALIETAIDRARRLGHRAIVLVGDEPYYRRFGFRADPTLALDLPGPVDRARFLALELVEGALDGARGMVTATGLPLVATRAA
jgi:predicted N-acetyltransferase YhbS